MSGTHGRFPPALPPEGGWPPPADGGHGVPRTQPPLQQPPQQQPPQQPRQAQPGWPPMPPANAPQAPTFPPRFPPQQAAPAASPPMAPADYGYGAPQRAPGLPEPMPPQQQAWQPQPPAPFPTTQPSGRPAMPPQRPPQPQQGMGYPPPQPDIPRTEPPRRLDTSSYDLGSYGLPPQQPAAQPPQQPAAQPPQPPRDLRQPLPPQQPQLQPPPQQWQQPQGGASFGFPPPQAQPPQPGFQQGAYPPPLGQPKQPPLGASAQPPADYPDEVEYDEPPRKRRRWLVVGALVGSIAIGSGMAYAYKLMFSPRNEGSQVVRAPKDAAKAAPNDRGGKQFPNADSRVNNSNRLPSEGSSTAAGGGDGSPGFTNSSGVRVVQTIPVGPGSSAVPGMTIVGPGTGPGSTLPPAAMQPPSPNALPPAIPSQKTAAAAPPPQQPPAARPPARPQPEAEPPQRVARAEPPKAPPTVAAPSAEAPAARPKTVSGYVAVLGFQRSQLDAMKMMADLQQKYDVLRDKKLEIVQSDQSARGLGMIYRVVVGPRGGITPVREVCNQLFQAGMPKQGCYPLAE